jgi:hypothetical protein
MDFSESFASQQDMCEFSACFSLATWFMPVLPVIGYPWPNGGPGSGKTKWGLCWAHTSYLGMVVLNSGSFAALRDLANYGATLLFDDAENLSDPKRSDPDKRMLFLAGNRRGAQIPLKEPAPDGGWVTKWINAFCPRGFTAIALPDPVLGSRSIRIPLLRTADTTKANIDPSDIEMWRVDRRALQDNLWATALALMKEADQVSRELNHDCELLGRDFEPWRGVLTVARLFDRHGVQDLESRMRKVMKAYQQEKTDNDSNDRAVQVLRAILHQLSSDVSDNSDVSMGVPAKGRKLLSGPAKSPRSSRRLVMRRSLIQNGLPLKRWAASLVL